MKKVVVALLILFGVIAYFNSLEVPFYFDDSDNIEHPSLRIEKLTTESIYKAMTGGVIKSRPVTNLSFALNYYLGEYRVQGYHVVNILIHILSAYLLYLFACVTLQFSQIEFDRRSINLLALSTALIWLVHPTATQSVTYVVQRMNSMAAMFYILSMLSFALGRYLHKEQDQSANRRRAYFYYVASILSGLLAIGSKEMAATLPLTILLYEWFFVRDMSRKWFKKGMLILVSCLGLVLVFAWHYTDGHILQRTIYGFGGRDFTLEERLYTQLRVVVHYIGLLFYPHPDRLTLDYDFPISSSLFTPISTLYAGCVLAGIFAVGVITAKKYRIISFCIFWFFITLSIESSIVPLEIIYEHRVYLPSMMICLLTILLCYSVVRNAKFVLVAVILVSVMLTNWTMERNSVWGEPLAFWQDAVKKAPYDDRVHVNLGHTYLELGEYDQAEYHFQKAIEVGSAKPYAFNELGVVWFKRGDNEKAEHFYKEALVKAPHYSVSMYNLAKLLFAQERYTEATQYLLSLSKEITRDEFLSNILRMLGYCYLEVGDLAKAESAFIKAVSLAEDDVDILNGYVKLLVSKGNLEKAVEFYHKSLAIKPEQPDVQYNTGFMLSRLGRDAEAGEFYRKATEMTQPPLPASYGYANYLLRNGRPGEAETYYNKFLSNTELIADAFNNLGLIYANTGEVEEGAVLFKKAVSVNPKHPQAARNLKLAEKYFSKADAREDAID